MSTTEVQPRGTKPLRSTPASKQASTKVKTPKAKGAPWWSPAGLANHFRLYWQLWIMVLPAIILVLIFSYGPMYGIQLAFRDFDVSKGITGGKWEGLKYFNQFFKDPMFWQIIRNTLRISLWTLVMGFFAPIILALLINQISSKKNENFRSDHHLHASLHLDSGHGLDAQYLPGAKFRLDQ